MRLTAKDIDTNMVFSIIVGVVAGIIIFPFLFIWEMLKDSSGSPKSSANHLTQAEIDARETGELGMIHQHYKISELGAVQGLKDNDYL